MSRSFGGRAFSHVDLEEHLRIKNINKLKPQKNKEFQALNLGRLGLGNSRVVRFHHAFLLILVMVIISDYYRYTFW